jgi:hypothetical protein
VLYEYNVIKWLDMPKAKTFHRRTKVALISNIHEFDYLEIP